MKKIFILPTFISLAMICSCQKQDSAAEQELAQRKTELDARENALDERMNALDERVKALDETVKILAENQKAMANAETSLTGVQGETPDPAQVQAERERIHRASCFANGILHRPQPLHWLQCVRAGMQRVRYAQGLLDDPTRLRRPRDIDPDGAGGLHALRLADVRRGLPG